jgi:hypothetical protein
MRQFEIGNGVSPNTYTHHADVRAHTSLLDFITTCETTQTVEILLAEFSVSNVGAVVVWHHVWDSGFGCSSHKLAVRVWWSRGCERDDKELLLFEGRDQASFIIVVDSSDLHAGGKLGGTSFTGDGCHGVLASFEKCFGEVLSDVAPSLCSSLVCFEFAQDNSSDLLRQWQLSRSGW